MEPSQQVDDITDDEGLLESLCKYLRDLHKSNDFKFKAMIVDIFQAIYEIVVAKWVDRNQGPPKAEHRSATGYQ